MMLRDIGFFIGGMFSLWAILVVIGVIHARFVWHGWVKDR